MITSLQNATIKQVRALQTQRRARAAAREFVLEGVRLVEETLRARAAPRLVLYTAEVDARGQTALAQLAQVKSTTLCEVSSPVFAFISETETPAGLLAVMPFPDMPVPQPLTLALVLDGLADPGNVGTLLRTAEAAGVEAVFLLPNTVEAYNPKVVRAAMGAHLRLPIVPLTWETLPEALAGTTLYVAEAGGGEAYDAVDWRGPCALIIGGEASGPSPRARQFAKAVHIPMPGPAESLNAAIAGGVVLFEIARQRRSGVTAIG